jgi:hypothetical protein
MRLRAGGRFRYVVALAPVAAAVGVAVAVGVLERAESRRQQETDASRAASRNAVFARGQLGEMLALCRGEWGPELGYEPAALAWTRRGIDAYFVQGTDTASLRQMRCGADGVTRGPRVSHPLAGLLPAEAPATAPDGPDLGEWLRAVERASARSLGAEEAAFELLRHPLTGTVLSRSWRGRPEGVEAATEPADAPAFPLLAVSGGFQPSSPATAPALRPLRRFRWTAETDAAFDLVARSLPGRAHVSELRLEPDGIDLRIEWPTPAFDGQPPAPYGDREFDEYGIPDMGFWYPRTEASFGCTTGATLASVRASFAEAAARLGGAPLAWAWYSCSPAHSDGRTGVWHLVPDAR